MDFLTTRIPYRETNSFSRIALDYIDQKDDISKFYQFAPSIRGIQQAIESRKSFNTNRTLLVETLSQQYKGINTTEKVKENIQSLLSKETFTITTAHQNNLFTGPLYFIYKIMHAIRLADDLNKSFKDQHFVPVFYMGSEDADLEELNHIYLGNEKLVWNTSQKGAVGRMKIDRELVQLIDRMEGQLTVQPFGSDFISLLRKYYVEGNRIQDATFGLLNELFAGYGLIVLLADNKGLKREMMPVFKDDLLQQRASRIVADTAARLEVLGYKVQANPRAINLFYMVEGLRERIEKEQDHFLVINSSTKYSEHELITELEAYPERFSPNVILRGLYQETILPNVVFIGGAGETAYWLQLKDLFDYYQVPLPVLLLRNSFLIVENKWKEKILSLGFNVEDFFKDEQELMSLLVRRESTRPLKLNGSIEQIESLYGSFKEKVAVIDPGLARHVDALKTKVVQRLHELEKKMLRAEKRKYLDQQRQIHLIKTILFPNNGLQERRENLAFYYSKWGTQFLSKLYASSLRWEQEFTVLTEALS